MSLPRAELRRLSKRRFTRYMMLLAVLVLGAVAVGMYVDNHKVTASEIAAAEQSADEDYQETKEATEDYREECIAQQESGEASDEWSSMDCESIEGPDRSSFPSDWYLPSTFEFKNEFAETITIFSAIFALMALMVGASYIGADWSSGGMMNLLLWRPHRLRVLTTKLGILLGWLTVAFVGLAVVWTGVFWLIGLQRGTTTGMTSGVWQSLALAGARGYGLTVIAGILGFALASIGRRTATALGAVVGALVITQVGLAILLRLLDVRFPDRWQIVAYVSAWMDKELVLFDYNTCDYSVTGGCQSAEYVITWQQSGVLFGTVALLLLVISAWHMRHRDIT